MLRSLRVPFDDAHDTLYEPNAVLSQFLGSAINSMTFFISFPFLACSSCLAFSYFSCLFLSFLSFFVFCFRFLLFCLLSFLFLFGLCFFVLIDLRLSCVCVVIDDTTCSMHVVVFLLWQAV